MLDNRGLLAVVSGFAAAQPPGLATATEAFLREVFARLESSDILTGPHADGSLTPDN
jgi:hypothetical protein